MERKKRVVPREVCAICLERGNHCIIRRNSSRSSAFEHPWQITGKRTGSSIFRSMPSIRSKLFLRDGGSDDEASGKTAAFMQITHSPGFKEGNVCKLHFLWIILSAKQHKSSANVMDKPFAELSKLFNVIFGIHFFPIPRVGRCLQNGLMIGTAL